MTPTLDTDLRALRNAAYADFPDWPKFHAAEASIRATFAELSSRVHTLEQENARLRDVEAHLFDTHHCNCVSGLRGES